MLDWKKEFDFDPDSAQRIANVIESHPMSLQHCAEILELAAPLCTVLTASGFMEKLREIESIMLWNNEKNDEAHIWTGAELENLERNMIGEKN